MSSERIPGRYLIPSRYWSWAATRRGRQFLSWAVTLFAVAGMLWHSFTWFDMPRGLPEERRRVDGNNGHTQIDFGGQWLMGRMIVCGHARELYHRQRQWEVAWAGFRVGDEPPVCQVETIVPDSKRKIAKSDETLRHDAESMLSWFMGSDSGEWRVVGGAVVGPLAPVPPLIAAPLMAAASETLSATVVEKVTAPAIGGPLYPPVHAFYYAPLGLIDQPQLAYRLFQLISAAAVFLAGLGVSVISCGRIWWSIATLALLFYPGTRGGLDLGQNPTISLAIVVWGWALAARGYPVAGGLVWGLFAFKPVWGLAFAFIPFLTRQWRFFFSMGLTGVGLAAATLPFVGFQTWLDWLHVGSEAAELYAVNYNWIMLSRDLHGIPRRILHDFSLPETERDTLLARSLAWSLWGVILGMTAGVYLRYGDRRRSTGVGIAFLFFAACLTCYRFMYYDLLLSAVGFAVLLAEPRRFLRTRVFDIAPVLNSPAMGGDRRLTPTPPARTWLGPRLAGYVNSFPLTILAGLYCIENGISGMNLQGTLGFGNLAHVTTGTDGATGVAIPKLIGDTSVLTPLDTYLVMAIWLWCLIRLARGEERAGNKEKVV